jgi:hypothetical protein
MAITPTVHFAKPDQEMLAQLDRIATHSLADASPNELRDIKADIRTLAKGLKETIDCCHCLCTAVEAITQDLASRKSSESQ